MKIISPPKLSTTLLVDAMYFNAAQENFKAANAGRKNIEKANRSFARLRAKENQILEKHHSDSFSAYDELEPLYIQMEGAEYSIGAAYGPQMQHLALTHILCAAAAEAHINQISKEELTGNVRDHFEKVSLEGKWLFLPKMLKGCCFDQGSEPFQSFSKLIKYRNALVHYKGKREYWEGFEQGEPNFLTTLGLSLQEAGRSLKSVVGMILELSKMMSKEPPYWLRKDYDKLSSDIVTNFFEITIEQPISNKSSTCKAAKKGRAP